MLTSRQVVSYLNRISANGIQKPTPDALMYLQRQHLLNVPFENLDIHRNVPIELGIEKLFSKVVLNNRGGFCYELNSLFNELLRSLGFVTRLISARVADGKGGFGNEFDHMAIIVSTGADEFLSDVGFGEFTFAPLKVIKGIAQYDERGNFIISQHDEKYLLVRKILEQSYVDQYLFTLQGHNVSEFEGMCMYHQTSPESHFVQKKLCSLPYEGGRLTVTGDILKKTEGSKITETKLNDAAEVAEALRKYFGIVFG